MADPEEKISQTGRRRDTRRTVIELAIIIAAILAVTLPFIGKPVHMDGIYFIDVAKAKMEEPWRDSVPDYDFAGYHVDRFRDTHPPLTAAYLAAVMSVTGGSNETVLHLAFVPFALLAGVAAYAIARRFVKNSLFATLLMVVAPGFVVMASDLMSDVPLMAFWLAAVATYIHGVDRRSWRLLAAAAVFFTLALFTAYEALALIPLLLLYAILTRRFNFGSVLPLAMVLALFLGYLAVQWLAFGEAPRLKTMSSQDVFGLGVIRFFPKTSSVLLFLGGTVIFPAAILAAFWPRRGQYGDYFTLVVLSALAPLFLWITQLAPLGEALQMFFLLPPAGLLIWGIMARMNKWRGIPRHERSQEPQWIFLGLWLGGILFYMALILYHASVKYLLPAYLPVTLLLADQAASRFRRRPLRMFQTAAVLSTAGLALLVGTADFQLAAAWHDYAETKVAAEGDTGTVWYTGEFGFRYYMAQHGFRHLLADDNRPVAGDTIIQPFLPGSLPLAEELSHRVEFAGEQVLYGGIPVKIINPPAGAGFYGDRWGPLPYSFSDRELDHIYVYRVTS
ncbi:MAG: ArnT family glycosyltransferase [Thermoleophilia bacterium]